MLSIGPLRLMRQNDPTKLIKSFPGSVFRRWFRLYLPCLASTFLATIAISFNAFPYGPVWKNEFVPGALPTLWENIKAWYLASATFVDPLKHWNEIAPTPYDGHTWTIGIEYHNSLILFLVLIVCAGATTKARCILYSVLLMYCYQTVAWHQMLFFSGLGLAELHLYLTPFESASRTDRPLIDISVPTNTFSQSSRLLTNLYWFVFACSAYLLSRPLKLASTTPGWIFLESLTPSLWTAKPEDWGHFYYVLGSIFALFAISRLSTMQALLDRPISQYFAKYSFSVYLVHGPLQQSLGYRLHTYIFSIANICEPIYGQWFPDAAARVWTYNACVAAGFCIMVPIIFYVSELFERSIEAPIVRLTRKLSKNALSAHVK